MFTIRVKDPKNVERCENILGTAALIGKSRDCDIRLESWRVGREHARIFRSKNGLYIQDLGQFTGTVVNGERIEQQYGPLKETDEISLGGYTITVIDQLAHSNSTVGEEAASAPLGSQKVISPRADPTPQPASPSPSMVFAPGPGSLAAQEPIQTPLKAQPNAPKAAADLNNTAATTYDFWRRRIYEQLLETIDMRRRDMNRMNDTELRAETEKLLREVISLETALPAEVDQARLLQDVLYEAVGLGPLEELLADETVTEIMINRFDEVYIERRGRLQKHNSSFTSDRAVLGVIERIVSPLGRRIDESSPMVDARLKDGSRVNAIIPPLALKGPTLTIRKFARRVLTCNDFISYGSMSEPMGKFLELCVVERKNIIVSGGTGSGKTTLLNVLSNFIPDGERIITIEDAAELRLNHSHLISLESRPSNAEGRGQITIRDLVKNSLRMRPDRIVVGECRGGEALDMLQAMNTGHEGSLTTLHANSSRDALSRLETLVLMAGMELPLQAIRDQVVSAIDIIVQQARLPDGKRIISGITEVTGLESGKIQTQELFRYESHGRDREGKCHGEFTGCGSVPSFFEELRQTGVPCDLRWFERNDKATRVPTT